MPVPKKVCDRLVGGMKSLGRIMEDLRARDVSEADTVTLVKDLLSQVFGYDKYQDVTGEFAIRGTYCDLAIRLNEKLVELIEVKAIGIELNDSHVKQAVDYAANQGVEWVILTNGIKWRLYNVIFAKPIDKKLISEIDLSTINCRREEDRGALYPFTKEGFLKGMPSELRDRRDATNRFMLAALILNNNAVLSTIRRELRRIVDVMVNESDILNVLKENVIKRDAIEGPDAESAVRRVNRRERRLIIKNHEEPSAGERADMDDHDKDRPQELPENSKLTEN